MADLTVQRTLVKSPPELWTELSEVEGLARHLGELGEIRITKVEPETTVAWEGEQISGTVEIEPSGWGTKVTLSATVPEPETSPEPDPVPEPEAVEPEAVVAEPEAAAPEQVAVEAEPEPAAVEPARVGFWARLFGRRRKPEAAAVEPEPVVPEPAPVVAEPEPEPIAVEPEPVVVDPDPVVVEPEPVVLEHEATASEAERVQQVLEGTLEALGQAHHRPFSRG